MYVQASSTAYRPCTTGCCMQALYHHAALRFDLGLLSMVITCGDHAIEQRDVITALHR
jgi:hypothetical protein